MTIAYSNYMNHTYLKYEDPSVGIAIEYPNDWNKEERSLPGVGRGVVLSSTPNSKVHPLACAISRNEENPAISIDVFLSTLTQDLSRRQIINFRVNSTTIDNNEARTVTFIDENNFNQLAILIVKNGRSYAISFMTVEPPSPEIASSVKKMINSLQLM